MNNAFPLHRTLCVSCLVLIAAAQARASGPAWVQAIDPAPWVERSGHATVVFSNKLWILGGESGNPYLSGLNDVWSSEDGVTWTQSTEHAGWSPRYHHTAAAFDNKLWVLGGYCYPGHALNDVWYSDDGVNWNQATASAGWPPRFMHATAVFKNRLWVVGGGPFPEANDVWSSPDGVNWTLATEHAPWIGRSGHAAAVFQDKLWVLGGYYFDINIIPINLSDIWYTSDGMNWTQATAQPAWRARYGHGCVAFDNSLWVLGGAYEVGYERTEQTFFLNSVYRSPDGVNWIQTSSPVWDARAFHTSAVLNGNLWVLAGWTPDRYRHDVWYFPSGEGEGEGEGETGYIEASHGGWVQEGETLTLTAILPGLVGDATYAWSKDATPLPDAASNTYEIASPTAGDTGWYGCQVTDQAKALHTLQPVLITVVPLGSLPLRSMALLACVVLGAAWLVLTLHLSKQRKRRTLR